jgi:hypothetical protein
MATVLGRELGNRSVPALRKDDQEAPYRAVRLHQARRRDGPEESAPEVRRRVRELVDVKPETLRGFDRAGDVDAGQCPGRTVSGGGRSSRSSSGRTLSCAERMIFSKTASALRAARLDSRLRSSSPTERVSGPVRGRADLRGAQWHDVPIAPSTYYAHRAAPCRPGGLGRRPDGQRVCVWHANRSLYGADRG